jgi:hypothetical protein
VTTSLRIATAATMMLAAAAPAARAQNAHTPIEIGVSAGSIVSWFTDPFAGGDVRVTVPVNDAGDVEVLAGLPTAATRHEDIAGFYGVQFRHRIRKGATETFQPFATYGGMGLFIGGRNAWVMPPIIGLVGGGVEQRLARGIALRVEAQGVVAFVPAGIRLAAGVSVPIGPARR